MTAGDEDGLQVRGGGGEDLHGPEIGDADHADVAVAPGLGGDPFDEVVGVLAEGDPTGVVVADVLAVGVTGAADVADDVDVVLGDDAGDVAGFDAAVPHGAGAALQRGGQGEGLEFLAVGAQGDQLDAVPHGDPQVLADVDGLSARVERFELGHGPYDSFVDSRCWYCVR